MTASPSPTPTFEEVYTEHAAFVRKRLSVLVRDPDVTDDLCQETFIKAWQALPRLRPNSNIGVWLWTIATNVARDHLRKYGRRAEIAPPLSYEALVEGVEGNFDIADTRLLDMADYFGEWELRKRAFLRLVPAYKRAIARQSKDDTYCQQHHIVYNAHQAYREALAKIQEEEGEGA